MKEAIRDPGDLCRRLGLPQSLADEAAASLGGFPLFVPSSYLARIEPGNPDDPLLRQVLPRGDELLPAAGFSDDPVGDLAASPTPGLIVKYRSRALMVTTGACAVHCRYCFRRHFPYSEAPRSVEAWAEGLAKIAADASLREVILSGGDPLTLADELLAELARRLAAIEHVARLRVHSRLPIVLPERVNDELVAWLTGTRLTPVMVVHANHPAELDAAVVAALARLSAAGVLLLNQSVLLRGVNDSADVLAELSERLIELRVVPYYLHQLDRVAGAAHFEVPVERGRAIVAELRERLSGYAVPRYVQEIAGAASKVPL